MADLDIALEPAEHLRCEHAREHGAEEAAHAVHAEYVERVVVAEPRFSTTDAQ